MVEAAVGDVAGLEASDIELRAGRHVVHRRHPGGRWPRATREPACSWCWAATPPPGCRPGSGPTRSGERGDDRRRHPSGCRGGRAAAGVGRGRASRPRGSTCRAPTCAPGSPTAARSTTSSRRRSSTASRRGACTGDGAGWRRWVFVAARGRLLLVAVPVLAWTRLPGRARHHRGPGRRPRARSRRARATRRSSSPRRWRWSLGARRRVGAVVGDGPRASAGPTSRAAPCCSSRRRRWSTTTSSAEVTLAEAWAERRRGRRCRRALGDLARRRLRRACSRSSRTGWPSSRPGGAAGADAARRHRRLRGRRGRRSTARRSPQLLTLPPEGESDLVAAVRHEAVWQAWLAAVAASTDPDVVPGERSSGIGRFVRGWPPGRSPIEVVPVDAGRRPRRRRRACFEADAAGRRRPRRGAGAVPGRRARRASGRGCGCSTASAPTGSRCGRPRRRAGRRPGRRRRQRRPVRTPPTSRVVYFDAGVADEVAGHRRRSSASTTSSGRTGPNPERPRRHHRRGGRGPRRRPTVLRDGG